MATKKKPAFEEALAELEDLTRRLEGGELTLDESVEAGRIGPLAMPDDRGDALTAGQGPGVLLRRVVRRGRRRIGGTPVGGRTPHALQAAGLHS